VVRVYHDVDIEEKNLYYVALTRGKKEIYVNRKQIVLETGKTRVLVLKSEKSKTTKKIKEIFPRKTENIDTSIESTMKRENIFQKYEMLWNNPESSSSTDKMYDEKYTTVCGHQISIKTIFKRNENEKHIQIIIRGANHRVKYMYAPTYENALHMVKRFLQKE